jgi:hypothetical protein
MRSSIGWLLAWKVDAEGIGLHHGDGQLAGLELDGRHLAPARLSSGGTAPRELTAIGVPGPHGHMSVPSDQR